MSLVVCVFFVKQKTAYEMRISDWSSDVCSSDLDAILRSSPESLAHIVAADDQIAAVIGAAAHQHMDMGIVCVPVIDGYPVERCAEIALGVSHQFAGAGAQVLHLAGILGREDETNMVPVVFAACGAGFTTGPVGDGDWMSEREG